MAEFYDLETAARVLGMSPEELRSKAQSREIRAFMDAGSWRFRKPDVEELARRRGMGSDPDLSLSDLDLEVPGGSGSGSDPAMLLSEFQLGVAAPDLAPQSREVRPPGHGTDQDILLDDLKVPPDPMGGSSSTILGMKPAGKLPSDSDVRLVPDNVGMGKGASDSDVRLAQPPLGGVISSSTSDVRLVPDNVAAPKKSDSDIKLKPGDSDVKIKPKPSDSDVTLVGDDGTGSSLEAQTVQGESGSSGETMMARSPFAEEMSSGEVRAGEEDSDFELTPSSVIDALQPESGSDFELTALDASDEFDTTPRKRGPSDSDVTGVEPSASGINLGRPSDSGINLQAMGGFDLGNVESIELAPLSDDQIPTGLAPKPPAPSQAPPPKKADLAATALPGQKSKDILSATALPLKAEKDIFEDTDFEVDALDTTDSSDDRTIQLEAASDFDLEDSDSASEVFAVDEDDVDQNAATAMAPAVLDEDEEAFGDTGEAISGETPSAWDVEAEAPAQAAARPTAAPVLAARGAEAEWGGLWVGLLGVATVFMMLLAFVGMDLVRNLYEFQGGGGDFGLVKTIAGMIGG